MPGNLALKDHAPSPQKLEKPSLAEKPRPRGNHVRAVLDRPPASQGWRTSDVEEIELRRWRGLTEIAAIEALEAEHAIFGTFRVRSGAGGAYEVEIRTLGDFGNSCGCIDHGVNRLGTCKHIEGVLAALCRRGVKAFRAAAALGSARVEVYLDRRDTPRPTLAWPAGRDGDQDTEAVRAWLRPGSKPTAPSTAIQRRSRG